MVANFKAIKENLDSFSHCAIKKQLFLLLHKIEERNTENVTVDGHRLKQKIIIEATQISKLILEIHDTKKVCKCFHNTEILNDMTSFARQKQLDLMMDYLQKLNGFIQLLDNVEVPKQTSNRPLNPLSKIFVPKYLSITKHLDLSTSLKSEQMINQAQKLNDHGKIQDANSFNPLKKSIPREDSRNASYIANQMGINISNAMPSEETIHDSYNKILKSTHIKNIWVPSNIENSTKMPVNDIKLKFDMFNVNWSVNAEDQKLLKSKALVSNCGCPPCFGYNVPPDFLGNPLKLKPLCCESRIHMSSYSNDYRKQQQVPHNVEFPNCSDDIDVTQNKPKADKYLEFRLKKHKKDFQKFVTDVVSNITEVLNETELSENSQSKNKMTKNKSRSGRMDIKEINKRLPDIPQGNSAYLGSIDKHDLLNGFSRCARLTQQHRDYANSNRLFCNAPCSVWCDSNDDKTWGWNKKNSHTLLAESVNLTNKNREKNLRAKPENTRNSLGESGYESSTCLDSSERNKCDFESEYWTPLPDCIPQSFGEKLGNRRPRSRVKSTKVLDESVKQNSTNLEEIVNSQMDSKTARPVLSESDFPKLK